MHDTFSDVKNIYNFPLSSQLGDNSGREKYFYQRIKNFAGKIFSLSIEGVFGAAKLQAQ